MRPQLRGGRRHHRRPAAVAPLVVGWEGDADADAAAAVELLAACLVDPAQRPTAAGVRFAFFASE